MVAPMARGYIAHETRTASSQDAKRALEAYCRVGAFFVDYSELSPEEEAATDPLLNELLAGSELVSIKKL